MNAGSHMVFFVMNVIVVVGVALTFKLFVFLTTARTWNFTGSDGREMYELVDSYSSRFERTRNQLSLVLGFEFLFISFFLGLWFSAKRYRNINDIIKHARKLKVPILYWFDLIFTCWKLLYLLPMFKMNLQIWSPTKGWFRSTLQFSWNNISTDNCSLRRKKS